MSYIELNKITKTFKVTAGIKTGIMDINLKIEKGETLGIVGINGAGKTTLIRHLMGFYKQKSGTISIAGLNPWTDAAILKSKIAYIPGEIGFPPLRTGDSFLKAQGNLEKTKDLKKVYEIAKDLNLDSSARLKTMSKGMKQKTAIITAFIRDKEILIFDEPTTGLDPLMRDTFVALINSERAKGKTIIFSTHIFLEAERCCDNVIFLDQGKIIKKINIESLLHHTHTVYRIGFNSVKDCQKFVSANTIAEINKHQRGDDSVVVTILGSKTQEFLKQLTKINVKYFTEIKHSLAHEFKKTFSAIINSEKR